MRSHVGRCAVARSLRRHSDSPPAVGAQHDPEQIGVRQISAHAERAGALRGGHDRLRRCACRPSTGSGAAATSTDSPLAASGTASRPSSRLAPGGAVMHAQVERVIRREEHQRVGPRGRRRVADDPVERDHPLEPLPHAVGVHVALDHQERAARVAGEHRPRRADGRREVEVRARRRARSRGARRRAPRETSVSSLRCAAAAMADRSWPASRRPPASARCGPAPMRTSTPSPCRGENAWRMISAALPRSFDLRVQRRRRGAGDRVVGDDAGREAAGFGVLEDRLERRAVGSACGSRRAPATARRCWSSGR